MARGEAEKRTEETKRAAISKLAGSKCQGLTEAENVLEG
jgi:hypothetical protein